MASQDGSAAREHLWREFVGSAARGEQSGLGALYDSTSALVYSVALRILRNPADAEEITADVYSHVWRTAPSYNRERGSVGAWLVMLVRSRAMDRQRSAARPIEDRSVRIEAPAAENAEPLVGAEERHAIASAIGQLTPEQRELIELAFYSGLSHTEIARHLAWPLGTVKTRIRTAIARLGHLLGHVRT